MNVSSLDLNKFDINGNHRAIVEDNVDPLDLGRVRVRIIGIHSPDSDDTPVSHLPWAEPALSLYYSGGNNLNSKLNGDSTRYTPNGVGVGDIPKRNTTNNKDFNTQDKILVAEGTSFIQTVPNIGSLVWVFFDAGNVMRPQYWAAATKKEDWIQHRKKLDTEIKNKINEITDIKDYFNPDTRAHTGTSCASEASVATKINKPRLLVDELTSIENRYITSFTSPGGVTYVIVNKDGKEKTYIIHKGTLEYIDNKGQKKILIGKTNNKNNDLEETIANNYELHIGGDFDVYVKKSNFIQVDGNSQLVCNGNVGIYSKKDVDIVSDGSINLDAKNNINIHAGKNIQYHAENNLKGKVNKDASINIGGNYNLSVKVSAKIKAFDMHLKTVTTQIFEASTQQSLISNVHLNKANTLLSINGGAITRINAGASIQLTSSVIDVGGVSVNVGGVVNMGSATSQPAPIVTPPTTDADTVAGNIKFDKSGIVKIVDQNPPN